MQLAAAVAELTPEARLALQSELLRRQIGIAEASALPKNAGDSHDSGHVTASDKLPEGQRQDVGDFVTEIVRTYHSRVWLFFSITAPAVVVSTIAVILARNQVREIVRDLPKGLELLAYRTEFVEICLVNFSACLVSWMAFSFSFGATCVAVEEIAVGLTPSAWRSLVTVRERLGPFLRLCLLLFFLVVVAEVASLLLAATVFWALRQLQMPPSRFLIAVVSYGVVALALLVSSRFALSVPALILDDCKVGEAMFRSDRLTEGRWMTLAAILAKSLVGGYVAAMCPFWLASLVRVTAPVPSWFPRILTLGSIIGVTVVEPSMFIGFALLYLRMSTLGSAPSKALTSQLA